MSREEADAKAGGAEVVTAVQTQLALLQMPLDATTAMPAFRAAMEDDALRARARFILLGLKEIGYSLHKDE